MLQIDYSNADSLTGLHHILLKFGSDLIQQCISKCLSMLNHWHEQIALNWPQLIPLSQKQELLNNFSMLTDRKSTRLNSSHQIISYAVFCLKKKKIKISIKTSYLLSDDVSHNDRLI